MLNTDFYDKVGLKRKTMTNEMLTRVAGGYENGKRNLPQQPPDGGHFPAVEWFPDVPPAAPGTREEERKAELRHHLRCTLPEARKN